MATIDFVSGTIVPASWLNDVDALLYQGVIPAGVPSLLRTSLGLTGSGGSNLIGFIQAGTGAAVRTAQDKLREAYSVKDFGALGDGTTDDSAAIQAAHDALPGSGGSLYFPPGTYKVISTITISKPTTLFGVGFSSAISTASGTVDVFSVTGQGVTFADLQLTASVTRTAGYFINFAGGLNANNYSRVERCLLTQWFNGIGFTNGGSTTERILDCVMTTSIVGGIGITQATTANAVDVVFRDILIIGPTAGAQLVAGISINNVGDATLSRVSTVKTGIGLHIPAPNGKTVQAVYVSDSYFDSGTGAGVQINPAAGGTVQMVKLTNVWSCSNTHGVLVNPSGTGATQRVEAINMTGSANAGGQGFFIGAGATGVSIVGGSFAQNVNGISIAANVTDFSIVGVKCGPTGQFTQNTGTGITIAAGTSANFTISQCDLRGNAVAGLSDGGSGLNKVITGNLGYGFASAVFDPPNLADGAGTTTTVTVTGAALGDAAKATFSLDLQGILLTAWVSSANTVSVRFQNETGGALDLASGTLRAAIERIS